jgi:hypothetical protein
MLYPNKSGWQKFKIKKGSRGQGFKGLSECKIIESLNPGPLLSHIFFGNLFSSRLWPFWPFSEKLLSNKIGDLGNSGIN